MSGGFSRQVSLISIYRSLPWLIQLMSRNTNCSMHFVEVLNQELPPCTLPAYLYGELFEPEFRFQGKIPLRFIAADVLRAWDVCMASHVGRVTSRLIIMASLFLMPSSVLMFILPPVSILPPVPCPPLYMISRAWPLHLSWGVIWHWVHLSSNSLPSMSVLSQFTLDSTAIYSENVTDTDIYSEYAYLRRAVDTCVWAQNYMTSAGWNSSC